LGRLVAEMQAQMEDLAWENTALEDRLRAALREQEAVEAVLDEMEDEHEDALARIHVLETQVHKRLCIIVSFSSPVYYSHWSFLSLLLLSSRR
jgi:predicted DNA-binding protein